MDPFPPSSPRTGVRPHPQPVLAGVGHGQTSAPPHPRPGKTTSRERSPSEKQSEEAAGGCNTACYVLRGGISGTRSGPDIPPRSPRLSRSQSTHDGTSCRHEAPNTLPPHLEVTVATGGRQGCCNWGNSEPSLSNHRVLTSDASVRQGRDGWVRPVSSRRIRLVRGLDAPGRPTHTKSRGSLSSPTLACIGLRRGEQVCHGPAAIAWADRIPSCTHQSWQRGPMGISLSVTGAEKRTNGASTAASARSGRREA